MIWKSLPGNTLFALIMIAVAASGMTSPVPAAKGWSIPVEGAQQSTPGTAQISDSPGVSTQQKLDLDEQVIQDVLTPLQHGLSGHNLPQVLSIFDKQRMPGYSGTRDQFVAFFRQYGTIRFRYKLLQVTGEKEHAVATAELDLEASPEDEIQFSLRRSTQMQFEMILGAKGWKIVGLKPEDFFFVQ